MVDDSKQLTLLKLNDDCLIHILSYLNVPDILNLCEIETYFNVLKPIIYRKYYKQFTFNNLSQKFSDATNNSSVSSSSTTTFTCKLENKFIDFILMEIGMYVTEVNVNAYKFKTPNSALLAIVLSRCPNMKILKLEGFLVKKKILQKFHALFIRIESLEFSNCFLSNYLQQQILSEPALQLHTFNFVRNFKTIGKFLLHLKHIVGLNLNLCKNINYMYFKQFTKNCTNHGLKSLNLNGCEWFNDSNLNEVLENFQQLETLVISNCYPNLRNFSSFAKLVNLTRLEINFVNNQCDSIDALLHELAKVNRLEQLDISSGLSTNATFEILAKFTQLRVIKLNDKLDLSDVNLRNLSEIGKIEQLHMAGCCSVSSDELIHFVRINWRTIKVLDISGCYGITDYFLRSIMEIINHRDLPVLIVVGGTQITEEFLIYQRFQFDAIRLSYANNYDPNEDYDYHICNYDVEESYERMLRRGLLNFDLMTSDSDTDDY